MKIAKKVSILFKGCVSFILISCSFMSYAIDCKNASAPTDIKRDELVQKVISPERLYFYDYPDESCKNEELFVVKKDFVFSFGTINGFTFVRYDSSSKAVYGWVKTVGLAVEKFGPIKNGAPITLNDFYLSNGLFTIRPSNTLDYLMTQDHSLQNNITSCDTEYLGKYIRSSLDVNLQKYGYSSTVEAENRIDDAFARFIGKSTPNQIGCMGYENKIFKEFANEIISVEIEPSSDFDPSLDFRFKTLRGIGIGSSEKDLLDAYGKDNLKHMYILTDPVYVHDLSMASGREYFLEYKNFGLKFRIEDEKVSEIKSYNKN